MPTLRHEAPAIASRRFRFDDFGIPEGSLVQFREGGISATVASPRKVILEGVNCSLTRATVILRRRLGHLAMKPGAHAHEWWSYGDRTLQQMWISRRESAATLNVLSRRNPTWSRDELILALDLYVRHAGNPPGKASPEVLALSSLLNTIGQGRGANSDFRNANGVYMKAMNFRRFDPAYIDSGRVGLQRGGKDEATVWETFADDPDRLRAVAEAIEANAGQTEAATAYDEIGASEGLQEALEGRLLTVQHVRRERSRKLVDAKKKAVVNAGGTLACEACGFDYEATYGERGRGFIECHHVQPLHSLRPGTTTKLTDLALVCASCHRMIHAKPKWLTMVELRSILRP